MDVQGLEAFWWVVQIGSITGAADKLHLTQPTVTTRIQVLEKDVGQPLFERLPNGMRLTDAGSALLPHAVRALQGVSRIRQTAAGLLSAAGGNLDIACSPAAGTYLLPALLSRHRDRHPEVEITVRTGRSPEVAQWVLDHITHLGLVHPPVNPHPEIQQVPVFGDEIVLVAHPCHPAARQEQIPLEQLVSEPFLMPDCASGLRGFIEQSWRACGLAPRVTMELDGIEAVKRMVLRNLGIALLPWSSVDREVSAQELAVVPVSGAGSLNWQTVLIYRRRDTGYGVIRRFLSLLAETYGVNIPAAPPVG